MKTKAFGYSLPGTGALLLVLSAGLAWPVWGNTEFIVNSVSDNANLVPGDGNCNTGEWGGLIAECTLRAAIQEANAFNGSGTVDIHFANNIATNTWGFSEILIGSGLPAIAGPVNLDGRTHPDYDDSTEYPQPRVVIRWNGGTTQWSAIRLNSGATGSSIRGLSIVNFTASGIRVADGGSYTIADNIIGGIWVPDLVQPFGNARHGIDFNGGSTSQASTSVFNNIIFDNDQHGILLRNGFSDGVIVDNIIGLRPPIGNDTAFRPLNGNGGDGIRIADDAGPNNAITNLFGSRGNVSSNNQGNGLRVLADHQIITGNKFGVAVDDDVADGYAHVDYANGGHNAVLIESSNNVIGGLDESHWNVLGNSTLGLRIGSDSPPVEASDNQVRGNYIGVTHLGNAVGMSEGIAIMNGSGNSVRGAQVANNLVGINIRSTASDTRLTRSRVVGNDLGVLVSSPTELGSTEADSGNLIGNGSTGVFIADGAGEVQLFHNWIGIDTDGIPRPNEVGIHAYGSNTIMIGHHSQSNVIGHNTDAGILIDEDQSWTFIHGNRIGALPDGTPAPNAVGIRFSGEPQWRIHVGSSGAGNIIANNTVAGVDLTGGGNTTLGNPIRFNQFYANGIGIDLGMTSIDAGGTATGPNDRLNFPQFDHAATIVDPESRLVTTRFRVEASPDFTTFPIAVDFYLADGNSSQGRHFVGTAAYEQVFAMDWKTAELTIPEGLSVSGFLTATATDSDGNTSQFSIEPTDLSLPENLFDDRFEAP